MIAIGDKYQRRRRGFIAEVTTVSRDWIGLVVKNEHNSMHLIESVLNFRATWVKIGQEKAREPAR